MKNPEKMSKNELLLVVKEWRKGLSRIATTDYRGNKPTESYMAEKLLEEADL